MIIDSLPSMNTLDEDFCTPPCFTSRLHIWRPTWVGSYYSLLRSDGFRIHGLTKSNPQVKRGQINLDSVD